MKGELVKGRWLAERFLTSLAFEKDSMVSLFYFYNPTGIKVQWVVVDY